MLNLTSRTAKIVNTARLLNSDRGACSASWKRPIAVAAGSETVVESEEEEFATAVIVSDILKVGKLVDGDACQWHLLLICRRRA